MLRAVARPLPSAVLGVALPCCAFAGSFDGEVALDALVASSTADGVGVGPEAGLASADLGARVRARLDELDERLHLALDYQGREPIAGDFRNSRHHLLYAGELRYDVAPGRVSAAAGRFVAPSVLFTPVDGLRVDWTGASGAFASAWAGRRGVTTGRDNVPLGRLLPALGAHGGWRGERAGVDARASWAADDVSITTAAPTTGRVGAGSGAVSGWLRPDDRVSVGLSASLAQQVQYTLGPRWADAPLTVGAAGLWSAAAWARVEPAERVRVGAEVHTQEVAVVRVATITGEERSDELVDPRFTDLRLRAEADPLERGWLRADARLRLRPDRTELRTGVGVDATDLGVPGLFAQGSLHLDHLVPRAGDAFKAPTDRLFWRGALGVALDAWEISAGASFVERAANPVSSRRVDPAASGEPTRSEDLAPFVLEAQDVAFLRGFYASRAWFAGVDLERGVHDAEWRAFVQVGLLGGRSW